MKALLCREHGLADKLDLVETFSSSAKVSWFEDPNPILEGISQGLDLDISPDGRWLAISSLDTTATQALLPKTEILRYDLRNPGRPRTRLATGTLQIGLRFSPDGSSLAFAEQVKRTKRKHCCGRRRRIRI